MVSLSNEPATRDTLPITEFPPLTIFCGKGGVGKTTLSLAHGLGLAIEGYRTLMITSHPLSELAVSISLQGLKESYPEAAARFYVVHIDPRDLLAARVRQQVPSAMLSRAIISNRIYQSLIEVAPGLKEIAFLARLQELAQRRSDDRNRIEFDLLIWDAPATGHFLQTLRVSRNFDTYLTGPFALVGSHLTDFFSRPENLRVYPVTTLEEMAVEETIEMCAGISELGMQAHGILCNLVSPLLVASDEEFERLYQRVRESADAESGLRFILDRHRFERERLEKLKTALPTPLHSIERVRTWKSDLDLLLTVSAQLAGLKGKAA